MRIAFIVGPANLYSNAFSGIVVQANSWARGLREAGHEVVFPQVHLPIDWQQFDVVHLFQHGPWCQPLIERLRKFARPVVVLSPIIDPPKPYGRGARLLSQIPFERLRLAQNQRLLRIYGGLCDRMLARSRHELASLSAVGVPAQCISMVHIPMAKAWEIDDQTVATHPRSGAVFHVSNLDQPRKNVRRLVELAITERFPLRLAGSIANPDFLAWLQGVQAEHGNITYLGRISDDALQEEMLSCAVFCLPSLFEGVGLVALEAAYCGANLAVTRCGGTPDYLGAHALECDPLDRESLKAAVLEALARPLPNMAARDHVARLFSIDASTRALLQCYRDAIGPD